MPTSHKPIWRERPEVCSLPSKYVIYSLYHSSRTHTNTSVQIRLMPNSGAGCQVFQARRRGQLSASRGATRSRADRLGYRYLNPTRIALRIVGHHASLTDLAAFHAEKDPSFTATQLQFKRSTLLVSTSNTGTLGGHDVLSCPASPHIFLQRRNHHGDQRDCISPGL